MIFDWLTTWGNLGPIVSILVSVLGFSVAVWQIRRTVSAVESANSAMEVARNSFARDLSLESLNRSLELIREIRELYADRNLQQAISRYGRLCDLLSRLREQHPTLNEKQKSEIGILIERLQRNERVLDRATHTKEDIKQLDRHVAALQGTQAFLSELSGNLQLLLTSPEQKNE